MWSHCDNPGLSASDSNKFFDCICYPWIQMPCWYISFPKQRQQAKGGRNHGTAEDAEGQLF